MAFGAYDLRGGAPFERVVLSKQTGDRTGRSDAKVLLAGDQHLYLVMIQAIA